MSPGTVSAKSPPTSERGQVLVMVALMFIILLGFAGFAIDVSSAYSTRRFERSVADSSSLAGAQDLQDAGVRTVTAADQVRARTHTLQSLVAQLRASGQGSCNPNADIVDCALPGTPYRVSVKTPSPSCSYCDPNHSVQVAIHNPSFATFFARIFGQGTWDVGIISVSGLTFSAKYAVITLRPPKPNRSLDMNADDINVSGGTHLIIAQGDVGTNTNVIMNGCGSGTEVRLDPFFRIDHLDATDTSTWCPPIPQNQRIPNPIPDPNYTIPSSTGLPGPNPVPAYPDTAAGKAAAKDTAAGCTAAVQTAILSGYTTSNWPTLLASLPSGLVANVNTVCYKPGVYNFNISNTSNSTAILLESGVYWFNKGLDTHGPLIGGYQSGQVGVSLVFTEGSQCTGSSSSCDFDGNNSQLIALNEGTCTSSSPVTCSTGAAPARTWDGSGWNGAEIKVTLGTAASPIVVPESIIVTKDPNCTVQLTEPTACSDNQNHVVNLPGGGNLFVAGVQYAPTDNVSVNGSSGGNGRIGQIIAWTVFYTGNSTITEFYPGGSGIGMLRIDAACSAPGEPCNP
jgi:hypothetical protein